MLDLLQRYDDAYLDDEARKPVGDAIRALARKDLDVFRTGMHALPVDHELLPHAYEALAEGGCEFEAFLLAELQRLLELAQATESLGPLQECVDSISGMGSSYSPEVQRQMCMLFDAHLNSARRPLRRMVLCALGDFPEAWERPTIDKLRLLATDDPDWRARFFARVALQGTPYRRTDIGLSILDQLRKKFLDPWKF